jgi:MFS family permease
VFSQFAGTSLWFAGNAIIFELQQSWDLPMESTGYITAAVQFGFILGTLVFAILAIADRYSPRLVFLSCALLASLANSMLLVSPESLDYLLILRFITGFFLAGIYPVGMKIAAGWYQHGLGRALGYLVGALVIGTAFPHLLRGLNIGLPWQQILISVSILAASGGVLMAKFVPDGPFTAGMSQFNPAALWQAFRLPSFRASAFGYFGHMWELYSWWAFLPLWLVAYQQSTNTDINISMWCFLIIAAGMLGSVIGGIFSQKSGSAYVAMLQLGISGICCLLSPVFFNFDVPVIFLFLLVWGITVVGDSPQFSTLNAQNAPTAYIGSALTIVNSIGFLITIFSIQLLNSFWFAIGPQWVFLLLLPGPVFGLLSMRHFWKKTAKKTATPN